jgi:[protein-PII] uridylyltransferase
VAPGNLTAWKEQLLTELYIRTAKHLHVDGDAPADESALVIAKRKEKVCDLLGERSPALEAWFQSVPDRYIALTGSKQISRHVQLTRRRKSVVAVEVVHKPRKSVSELSVCAADAPGLLAKIAGVLLANRVDVLSAQISSRDLGGGKSEALDVFTTRDRYGRPITDEKRWQRVEEDLGDVLSGAKSVEALIAERRERSTLPERVVPAVRTEIEVDNEVSTDFSVIDVYTQDRLGVLYTITQTLAHLGLDIHLSKIATEAVRVADVFYVREANGGKLDEHRVDEVRLAVAEALGRLQIQSR